MSKINFLTDMLFSGLTAIILIIALVVWFHSVIISTLFFIIAFIITLAYITMFCKKEGKDNE